MSKTFNSFDLIVICSLLWNLLKALVKVLVAAVIFAAVLKSSVTTHIPPPTTASEYSVNVA